MSLIRFRMTGPRLSLQFGRRGTCFPFSNCTQRNDLINILNRLNFEIDGLDNSMECAHSRNTYVLLCRSFYESFAFHAENLQSATEWNATLNTIDSKDRLLILALIICGMGILCLLLNTFKAC